MPYVSKDQRGHAQWVGIAELLKIVQAESGCSVEAAREQIRNALADSEIWPLDWEPAPISNAYCHPKYGPHAAAFKKPVSPPPPSSKSHADFVDRRSVLHWRSIRIDWEQGRVLDDFEHEAYQRIGRYVAVPGDFEPTELPRPRRRPEWRTLRLDRKASERIWPSQPVADSSKPPPPMSDAELRASVETTFRITSMQGRPVQRRKSGPILMTQNQRLKVVPAAIEYGACT